MFFKTKPSDDQIQLFLTQQSHSRFSYSAVGASATRSVPRGYVNDYNRVRVGVGQQAWNRAVTAVDSCQMFNMPWLQLHRLAPLIIGTNVAVLIKHFGFWSLNAARVVYTVNDRSGSTKRYGFAYGTLFDHAESGEERFLVERHEDDSVWYDLFAFSRPNATLAKLGYPFTRWLQHRFADGSKEAMIRAIA
jgi:uncharacterized protein (UPF0548 family)